MIYAAHRCNESYPRKKYTLEIDPELIISDQANTRYGIVICLF